MKTGVPARDLRDQGHGARGRSAWAQLKHGWGSAYDFQRHGPVVRAVRRDGLGQITANSPEQLGPLVAADYAERPVPRTAAA